MNDFTAKKHVSSPLRAYKLEQKRLKARRRKILGRPRELTDAEERELVHIQNRLRSYYKPIWAKNKNPKHEPKHETLMIQAAKVLFRLPKTSVVSYETARKLINSRA